MIEMEKDLNQESQIENVRSKSPIRRPQRPKTKNNTPSNNTEQGATPTTEDKREYTPPMS